MEESFMAFAALGIALVTEESDAAMTTRPADADANRLCSSGDEGE